VQFVKKPGGKRRSWDAKLFPFIPEKEEAHEIEGYDD